MERFYIGLPGPTSAGEFERSFISWNAIRERKSDFKVNRWIMDSGAFTEIAKYGMYVHSVEEHASAILRWSRLGVMEAAVAQDYMCEKVMLDKTGLTVADHQRLTLERYDRLVSLVPSSIYILPSIQGYTPSEYQAHIRAYGPRLKQDSWVGVGSVCKRNANPQAISDVLCAIKSSRPDLRIHGFGLKLTALSQREVRKKLYSADSIAWCFAARMANLHHSIKENGRTVHNSTEFAHRYYKRIASLMEIPDIRGFLAQ